MNTAFKYSRFVLLTFAFCLTWLEICPPTATAQDIQWRQSLAEAKAEAADTNRLVWLHFSADWCSPCKKLETFVFKNTGVVRTSDRNVVAVKIDVDENDSLVRELGVPRIPYDIVMTPEGETIVNRPSPRDSSDYLKMFNSLDGPLQSLNTGDRESINAGINQVQRVLDKAGSKAGGLRQNKNDLDLEGPSHQMAATTIEGQRLERGLSSSDRAVEIRAIEARLLKQKAQAFIAQEEQRLNESQAPKFSDNPFFKGAGVSTSPSSKEKVKVVSNQFVVQRDKAVKEKATVADSSFLPPSPVTFSSNGVEKNKREGTEDLKQHDEGREFSFPMFADAGDESVAEKTAESTESAAKVVEPKLTLPKFAGPEMAELKQPLLKMPEFRDGPDSKTKNSDFAYAPINDLKQTLMAADPAIESLKPVVELVEKKKNDNPLRSTSAEKASAIGSSDFSRPVAKPPTKPVEKSRPETRTAVAVPQAPVMVEGVVQIAEATIPAVEGRLVAAEQPVESRYPVQLQAASVEPRPQVSRTDRMLEQVNFFAPEKPIEQPTQVTIVQAQPAPQPQVVINLNTGSVAKPVARNHGRIIQPGTVSQASATTASANRARIKTADVASAVRSKYALKGKCPVTLLTQGQWVDGKKEIGCVHRDRVYLFASAENREAFLASPDQLSPLLAGFDPVIFEETGKLIEGEEQFGTFMGEAPNQRIVLFKTADTRDRFQKEPVKYINLVRNAMTKNGKKVTKLQ